MEKKTTRKNRSGFSKYVVSMLLFLLFEAVAITLWLTKNNLFYLLNFSYIGCCLSLGTALFTAGKRYARHFVQLAVGCYMLLYLGVFSRENMQIEGFWYYLFLGTFEAATIHYAVAKIFGPLLFGRGWCGYACWTAMVLDFLPYKQPAEATKGKAGDSALCDVFIVAGIGFSAVSDAGHTFGENHVLDVPCRKCVLLPFRNYACLNFQG